MRPLIDADGLAAQPGAVVLDATVALPAPAHDGDHRAASGRDAWERAHIPGSVHADLLHELSDQSAPYHFARPDPDTLARQLGALGVTDGATVVVYDTGGGIWAARLWWLLRWIGVDAAVLDGGLAAWAAAGHPVASGPATPEPGTLTPRVRGGLWVDRPDLEGWMAGDAAATVVCALSPEVFRGDVPTRYARRGHIPGSINLPARALAELLLSPAELRSALDPLVESPDPVWVYCGGGISAASLALALALAGRDDVAVYDGSLEEWAADPELPLSSDKLSPAVRALLDAPEFAVLSTLDPDGSPHATVMWVGRDGDALVLASKNGRRQVRNLRRDPRATVLVYERAKPTRYVEVRGTATLHEDGARDVVDRLARAYIGADHAAGPADQERDRVVIRIAPERVYHRG
ncbi:hypothetical protein Prum_095290 [Phytohabitans rumicis]|uniref:Rhodanese domain-containing protein n=1 Tax=Phytohabitans rumicis TaxID=1076125 RepID=A0A6V8LP65_9ACTN|nr:hypothetical protein Prum_095290 [Phytohabitans rumicis]